MKYVRMAFIVIILFVLNFVIVNLSFFPLNHLSLIPLLIFWSLILSGGWTRVVILVCFTFLLDLFNGMPFGINMMATLLSLQVMNWILTNVLTNRSVFIFLISSFLSVLIYRFIYFSTLFLINFFTSTIINIENDFFIVVLMEMIVTTGASVIFYFIFYRIIKSINPSYIKRFKI